MSPADGSAPADGSRAIHQEWEVLCCRCGEPTAEGHAEVRRRLRPCGLCRAELLGTVYLVAPTDTLPNLLLRGPRRRDANAEEFWEEAAGGPAIHRALLAWGHALGLLLSQLRHFDQHLMETTPEEAVADAVMGAEPLAGVRLRGVPGDVRSLALEGLPPEVARRLVRDTFATPPSCGAEDKA